jgi:hypothetical protein
LLLISDSRVFDTNWIQQKTALIGIFSLPEIYGLASRRHLPAVGCEAVAKFVHDYVSAFVKDQTNRRVWVESVEISEHSGNSASYQLA